MEGTDGGRICVKVGSIAFLAAAGIGYGIGLDDTGRRVEFVSDWSALSTIQRRLQTRALYVEVATWQIIAVNEEIRLDLGRQAMAQRAAFLRSVVVQRGLEDGVHEPLGKTIRFPTTSRGNPQASEGTLEKHPKHGGRESR